MDIVELFIIMAAKYFYHWIRQIDYITEAIDYNWQWLVGLSQTIYSFPASYPISHILLFPHQTLSQNSISFILNIFSYPHSHIY